MEKLDGSKSANKAHKIRTKYYVRCKMYRRIRPDRILRTDIRTHADFEAVYESSRELPPRAEANLRAPSKGRPFIH
jgi:hypothetical protein